MRRKKRMDRRQERRGQAPSYTRYQMQQELIAIGKDFWIENEQGQKAFKVDGKALRIREQSNLRWTTIRRRFRLNASLDPKTADPGASAALGCRS